MLGRQLNEGQARRRVAVDERSDRRGGAAGGGVIAVDTKKKELVGDFKSGGREWHPKGQPVPVRVHDFKDKELGKAIPYGIYDLADDSGWVKAGMDTDTSKA